MCARILSCGGWSTSQSEPGRPLLFVDHVGFQNHTKFGRRKFWRSKSHANVQSIIGDENPMTFSKSKPDSRTQGNNPAQSWLALVPHQGPRYRIEHQPVTILRLSACSHSYILTFWLVNGHSQQFFRWIYDVNTRTYSGEPLMVGRAIWSAANMALKLGRNSFSWCRTACNPFSIGTGKSGRNTTDRAWSGGNRGIRYYTEKAGECSPAALLCSLRISSPIRFASDLIITFMRSRAFWGIVTLARSQNICEKYLHAHHQLSPGMLCMLQLYRGCNLHEADSETG